MKGLIYDTAIGDLLKRVELLDEINAWFDAFNEDIKDYIIYYLLQKEQLEDLGIDEDNDVIGLYSQATEMMNPLKKEGTHFTLYDSGDFFNSMIVKVFKDEFIIDADGIKVDENGKTANLFELYGDGIIGLTEYNKERLSNRLKENYIKYVRETLQIP
jgi:hypothetical protein